ncbi:STAS domain-containing protein [Oryzifoliimicrobium ureilyticus]|uniref:STAS domain-containing protein n=1 Tax=Oryzifoliimicrobium ureilyticus TaxID=3113724 RepID=UPI00307654B7
MGTGLTLEQTPLQRITLPNNLTIRNISEIYSTVGEAFTSSFSLCLDIPAGAQIDLSFVQMIEALRRQARDDHKDLTLAGPVQDNLATILRQAGLWDGLEADDKKFWLHEGVAQ